MRLCLLKCTYDSFPGWRSGGTFGRDRYPGQELASFLEF